LRAFLDEVDASEFGKDERPREPPGEEDEEGS
jgi:hypothetical protein